jgi:hypothetical protein
VAQRSIEILIGRLLTNESFRRAFLKNPSNALQTFCDSGHELTPLEINALSTTAVEWWSEVADKIDPRLQQADLGMERLS